MDEFEKQYVEAEKTRKEFVKNHTEPGARYWPSMARIETKVYDSLGIPETKVIGNCLRRNYYHCTGEEESSELSPRVALAADIGNLVEDLFGQRVGDLKNFQRIFPDINGNKLRYRKAGISGEADLVLKYLPTKELFGVEMKTYDGFWAAKELMGYQKAKEIFGSASAYVRKYLDDKRRIINPEFIAPGRPKESHLLQTLLYLEEFKKSGIKLWKIIYIGRDKAPRVEFDVSLKEIDKKHYAVVNGELYKDYCVEEIFNSFNKLAIAIKQGNPPPPDFVPEYDSDQILKDPNIPKWKKDKVKNGETIRDWKCSYCPFLEKCLDDLNQVF